MGALPVEGTRYDGDQKCWPHNARRTSGQPCARITRLVFVLIAPTRIERLIFGWWSRSRCGWSCSPSASTGVT